MTDYAELKKLAEAYFPERLSVDYVSLRSLDDESLYAFLMHGPKDDGDHVCVDENPDQLDGPPSPRLETIAEVVNAFPELLAQNASLKAEVAAAKKAKTIKYARMKIAQNDLRDKNIALEAALQEAREALEPFLAVVDPRDLEEPDSPITGTHMSVHVSKDDLRRAFRAHEAQGG
ncbi:MAG: hypothetical protein AAGL99_16970 [Pseudomonadota bacterium]